MGFLLFRSLLLFGMLLVLAPWQAEAEQVEIYCYQQRTGSQVDYFDWQLTRGSSLHLKTRQQLELTETRFNSDLSTLRWKIQNVDSQTDLTVDRAGNTLVMQGVFAGEIINKEVHIDAAPWYQALSVSLRQFTDHDKETLHFWSIRPDTLDVHRLQVTRQKNTLIDIGNDSVSTIQLKIQPTGWRAPFWSANYWLRENDGVFVRYQGRSGPPGAPETSILITDSGSTGPVKPVKKSCEFQTQ